MFHILPLLVTCFVCSIVGPLSYLPLFALFWLLVLHFLVPPNGQVILYHPLCHCVVLHIFIYLMLFLQNNIFFFK